MALDKDPNYVRALVVMGQTLLQKEQLEEASDYLERAVTKVRIKKFLSFIFNSPWSKACITRNWIYLSETMVHIMSSNPKGLSF